MSVAEDPFKLLIVEEQLDDFAVLRDKPASAAVSVTPASAAVSTAVFHGFDLEGRPLLTGVTTLEQEIVSARTTVPLTPAQVGSTVVVLCERGDARLPIVVGVVLDQPRTVQTIAPDVALVSADDRRIVLSAEREIVLRCGDASITLTRAGKVIIQGSYIVSRSTGYNKIKGAAVDIN